MRRNPTNEELYGLLQIRSLDRIPLISAQDLLSYHQFLERRRTAVEAELGSKVEDLATATERAEEIQQSLERMRLQAQRDVYERVHNEVLRVLRQECSRDAYDRLEDALTREVFYRRSLR